MNTTETSSLVIFSKASLLLAEADTIQKAKELKSMALTAAEWAKRKNMGEEAIQHCRSYALEAERKMGEMLLVTERAKGGNPNLTCNRREQVAPTLPELGISRKESAEAQMLAELPAEDFEKIKSGKKTKSKAKKERKAHIDR